MTGGDSFSACTIDQKGINTEQMRGEIPRVRCEVMSTFLFIRFESIASPQSIAMPDLPRGNAVISVGCSDGLLRRGGVGSKEDLVQLLKTLAGTQLCH